MYHLSRSFIYRVIHFTFNLSRREVNGRLIKRLLGNDDLSAKVREISILWAPSAKLQPGEGSKEDLELLGEVLPKMNGLKIFVWDAQYPIISWLLEILQTHCPQILLYTRHHPMSPDPSETLPRLCASPCLFSLDGKLTTRESQKVLTSAPHLRDLTVASIFNTPHVPPYQEQGEPKPLHLRSLELYGHVSDTFKIPVAWPMLERLSLDSLSYLPSNEMDFAGLKSLRVQNTEFDTYWRFIGALRGCKQLEVLDLTGFTRNILEAGEEFSKNAGKTLIKLRLHEEEDLDGVGGRPLLSFTQMGYIAKHCGNLRSLGLDFECDGQEWVSLSFHLVLPSNIMLTISKATYDAQLYRG